MALTKLLDRWVLAYRRAQRLPLGRSQRVAHPVVRRYARVILTRAIREGII